MASWGDGYKQGYRDAAAKLLADREMDKFMEEIERDELGAPSKYAVAHTCCGGVDAHDVKCSREGAR